MENKKSVFDRIVSEFEKHWPIGLYELSAIFKNKIRPKTIEINLSNSKFVFEKGKIVKVLTDEELIKLNKKKHKGIAKWFSKILENSMPNFWLAGYLISKI